ncbi:hypothetical protein SAMN04488029_2645 [Reichenbachiella faecimaris]|uniref:HEAT repeat-containing protein n=1 Tax=Reichenbachiella faecimaris TaxID=692418 RepID=A0A1W2GHE2_REIFA|nr:hypothetical protein [Reichenbachiella faecimaris]SMD35991.1 hypothetical protein SAMN04488029_2645 [Reichenbachiella faecimaris]
MKNLTNILPLDISPIGALVLVFVGLSIAILASISFSRAVKRIRLLRTIKMHSLINESLNMIAISACNVNDNYTEIEAANIKLHRISRRSRILSQYISDRLIQLRKNLSGMSSSALKKLYDELQLHRLAKQKLMQGDHTLVIKGIQELAEMKRYEDLESIVGFLHHYHSSVRRETRVALINLSPDDPLVCMKQMKDPLSKWEKVLIYNKLRSLAPDQVPLFKTYFEHPNPAIVCFCIELAARFLQYDAIGQITKLAFHQNVSISYQAVNAIKLLEADQAVNHILVLLKRTKSVKVKIECVECLAQIGDSRKLAPLFEKALNKTKNSRLLKSLSKTFANWDKVGSNVLSSMRFTGKGDLMINHYSHRLIN